MAQNAASLEHAAPEVLRRPSRPIDLVHLARQCLGDVNLEYEILRLFDTTVATYFQRLQQSTSGDDIAMNLHALKGAASGVGAWTIADIAKAAEVEFRAGQHLPAEHLSDLSIAVEEVHDFIAQILTNEPT